MNYSASYHGPCKGKECQERPEGPRLIDTAWIGARMKNRCNRCYRLEFQYFTREETTQKRIERGELVPRSVWLEQLTLEVEDEPTYET